MYIVQGRREDMSTKKSSTQGLVHQNSRGPKQQRAERLKQQLAEVDAEAQRISEERRIEREQHAEKNRKAEDEKRRRDEKREEERQKMATILDSKLSSLRDSLKVKAESDVPELSELKASCEEQVIRMKDAVHTLEKDIDAQICVMRKPGWLKTAHQRRKRDLMRSSIHEQTTEETDTEEQNSIEVNDNMSPGVPAEKIWTGSDADIAHAREIMMRLDTKIPALMERIQAAFMSETTRNTIQSEITKCKETRDGLHTSIETTLRQRAIDASYKLPAHPCSAWINLSLLRQQHQLLLSHSHLKRQAQKVHDAIFVYLGARGALDTAADICIYIHTYTCISRCTRRT
jgi:hypothetical protein